MLFNLLVEAIEVRSERLDGVAGEPGVGAHVVQDLLHELPAHAFPVHRDDDGVVKLTLVEDEGVGGVRRVGVCMPQEFIQEPYIDLAA